VHPSFYQFAHHRKPIPQRVVADPSYRWLEYNSGASGLARLLWGRSGLAMRGKMEVLAPKTRILDLYLSSNRGPGERNLWRS
jgi:hypothetical protein